MNLALFEDEALTVTETNRLQQLEGVIATGLQTFVEVGNALLEIRDSRLYRREFGTFEDYCRDRWGFTRMRASQLINAAEVVFNLDVNNCLQVPATESQARPLTALEPELQRQVWQNVIDTAPDGKITAAHVQNTVDEMREFQRTVNNSLRLAAANHVISDDPDYNGDEWYTPAEYIDAARRLMGSIDLDPATSEDAQSVIDAATYYTKRDNGLTKFWFGNVWLNPPYSMPLIKQFVSKLIESHENGDIESALILTNNSSDTAWFHDLLSRYPACFTRGRVQFWRPNHDNFGARQGQAIFYVGDDIDGFRREFGEFGQVVTTL